MPTAPRYADSGTRAVSTLRSSAAPAVVDERVLLPAAHADDAVADREARMAARDDLAHRAADHDLAERLRCGVGLARRSCGRACTGRATGSGGAPAPGRARPPAPARTRGGSCRRSPAPRGRDDEQDASVDRGHR